LDEIDALKAVIFVFLPVTTLFARQVFHIPATAVQTGADTLVTGLECFNLDLTLCCGQAFRWQKTRSGGWHGVAFGRALDIRQSSEGLLMENTDITGYESVWKRYFSLDTDYAALCGKISRDGAVRKAVEMYPGIRLLRQEPWEALCSFILSQNNNIPRIKGIIERLCAAFGEPLGNGDYAFPSAERLAALSPEDFTGVRAGFRIRYLLDAAQKAAGGAIDLPALAHLPAGEARGQLMLIKGVGPKVADCTLLYGCGHTQAFPVDVWVRRVLDELYPAGLPECLSGCEGIAQQYLFHWRRNAGRSE